MVIEWTDILLRLGMAFLTGFVLGFERERHGRPAGLRTTVLVSVAACLAAILSDVFYGGSFDGPHQSRNWHPDPARLAAGVLTGIGFLGAGVIMRQGNLVRGVTTASQIWFVTILGLCYGSGQLLLGFIGLLLSIVTVMLLRFVESWIHRDWYASLNVMVTEQGISSPELIKVVEALEVHVKNLELTYDAPSKTRTMQLSLRFKRDHTLELPEKIVSELIRRSDVIRVEWK